LTFPGTGGPGPAFWYLLAAGMVVAVVLLVRALRDLRTQRR
jgi:hypothetical protein